MAPISYFTTSLISLKSTIFISNLLSIFSILLCVNVILEKSDMTEMRDLCKISPSSPYHFLVILCNLIMIKKTLSISIQPKTLINSLILFGDSNTNKLISGSNSEINFSVT